MRVSVIVNHRFFRAGDGRVYTGTSLPYRYWRRYLHVFDQVQVVARVASDEGAPQPGIPADGDGVSFLRVPDYRGPSAYLSRSLSTERTIRRAVEEEDAVIFRVPSHLTVGTWSRLLSTRKPYAVEVVGDPHEEFSLGAVVHPLRPLFRSYFYRVQKWQCAAAAAAAYVTTSALQARYPSSKAAFSTHYSDVELPPEAFLSEPRCAPGSRREFTVLFVGSLAQLYKGPDVLLNSSAICLQRNASLKLLIVGDGEHRLALQGLADRLGISARVRFLGELPAGSAVRDQMDRADLFVLPSRTEGLPRALIEAMARGLPCVGTTVGGVPELLPAEDLVRKGDAIALADKIMEVTGDPSRLARMSARNLARAANYQEGTLDVARQAFCEALRESTAGWLADRPSARGGWRY